MPAAAASGASSSKATTEPSDVVPWFFSAKVSVAAATTFISRTPAAAARSNPRRFSTRPMYVTPSSPGRAASTSSASAICGTRAGLTNDATSMRRTPAATQRRINSTLASVGSTAASACNPSRGETSTTWVM